MAAVARKERLAPDTIAAIGKRIRTLIGETTNLHAFTQRTGIAYQTILAWEKGTKQPELPLLFKIARALDVPVYALLSDPPPAAPTVGDTPAWELILTTDTLERYRRDGVSEAQIEWVRTFPFDFDPEAGDYTRLLDAALLSARSRPHRSHIRRREVG